MSSSVEAGGVVAAAVVLPVATAVAAVYGVGWLAWQSGKLLIEANRAVDRQIAVKKQQIEEAERHRRLAAISAHSQLVDMCNQIILQLENNTDFDGIAGFAEIEQIKYDLHTICNEPLPEDISQIESLTSLGYLRLDKAVRQQRRIASMNLSDSETGLYRGLSVADLMDDLRIVVGTMKIQATSGVDVVAADPAVLERVRLNEQFASVTAEIVAALETIDYLSRTYGLTSSGNAWFRSCFNGIDASVEMLCKPSTTNIELKKGIKRLREMVEQYQLLAPSIEEDLKRMFALYNVYVDAAKALGEKVQNIKFFKDSAEIDKELRRLQRRAEKAEECAKIYRKLGASAYLCYAWDQELQAMGYEVHSRKKIQEMADKKPQHAELDDKKLPFYQWTKDDMTQLYSLSEQCSLQVIVHDDGTVTMKTIAAAANDDVVTAQHRHCSQLRALYEKLKENWFILYDYEETESPDSITTISQWRSADNNAWRSHTDTSITDHRTKRKNTEKAQHMQ